MKFLGAAILIAFGGSACSQMQAGDRTIKIEPGELGTFLAVGAELEDQAKLVSNVSESSTEGQTNPKQKPGPSKGRYDFTLLKSKTDGITIGTATLGPSPITKNESSDRFMPASITKVITAALALKTLGPSFRFKTEVRWIPANGDSSTAHDLTVIADGDPTINRPDDNHLGSRPRIIELVKELKSHGIRRVTGKLTLVSADERKDIAVSVEGIHPEDHTGCNGALAQAFNYRQNCAGMAISGVNKARWGDSDLEFPIRTEMKAGEKTAVGTEPVFDSAGSIEAFVVRGTWGTKRTTSIGVALPVPEAKPWFGNVLLSEMRKQGIDVSGVEPVMPKGIEAKKLVEAMRANASAQSLELPSAPLRELVQFMNKPSNNFIAESLFKAIAAQNAASKDLRKLGVSALKENIDAWMKRNGHPEYADEIHLLDGAGLSRSNHASPRAYLALLKEFTKEPFFNELWSSLAIAGVDGTLAHRMQGTCAQGTVHAKTGTLKGAYQLAGYVPRKRADGSISEYVPFVILSATTPGNRHRVRAFQDQLVVRLMEVVNQKPVKVDAPM